MLNAKLGISSGAPGGDWASYASLVKVAVVVDGVIEHTFNEANLAAFNLCCKLICEDMNIKDAEEEYLLNSFKESNSLWNESR